MTTIADFAANLGDGLLQPLAQYRGQVLLIVNTASECGYTRQYAGLQELHSTYQGQGFSVLGFPCNQFGGQEPGDARAIRDFCVSRFGVSFPLFEKGDVNGGNASPLWHWLTGADGKHPHPVKWNFTKFLIDRDGKVVRHQVTIPEGWTSDMVVEALMKEAALTGDVATPADPASSRMGESIYRFALREMPGALRRAWALEKDRLARQQQPQFSWHNEILQPALITLLLWTALALWLGLFVLPFLVVASFWANFQLTSANYVEHYGLLRTQDASGRYEPCQPHHSWNSNHLFSNWALFHLQRHSDHHAHPLRRYQSLRHFDHVPQLPIGYFGMFTLAYVPPLWRRVMDPRLLAMAGRDATHINIDPRQRAQVVRRYGLRDGAQPVG